MDSLSGLHSLLFRPELVLHYFQSHRQSVDYPSTIERELLTGYIVYQMLDPEFRKDMMIGVPCVEFASPRDPNIGFTVEELIQRSDVRVVADDCDIVIGQENCTPIRLQIARVVVDSAHRGRKDLESVLLGKIAKTTRSPWLVLAIVIEESTTMEKDSILTFLAKFDIPFGSIWLVGKRSNTPGEFQGMQIYPNWQELIPITIPMHI